MSEWVRGVGWVGVYGDTYGNAVAKARGGLGASSAYVVPHARVLAGGAVQVGHGPWAVGAGEASRPCWVTSCQGKQGQLFSTGAVHRSNALREKLACTHKHTQH